MLIFNINIYKILYAKNTFDSYYQIFFNNMYELENKNLF